MLGENNYSSYTFSQDVQVCGRDAYAMKATIEHPFEREFLRAQSLAKELMDVIYDLYAAFRCGSSVSVSQDIQPTIERCQESISRNLYAWLALCQTKRKQSYLIEHAFRTTVLSMSLASALKWDSREILKLGLSALLSDVGKVMIPSSILNKEGALTSAEYAVIRVHPLEGRKLLQQLSDVDASVIDIVVSHHERIDGQGYPQGLTADQIPLSAKLIAITDAFDAMTSERAYASARSIDDAMKILVQCKGKQFDESLTDAFLALLGNVPSGLHVKSSSGRALLILEPGRSLGSYRAISLSDGLELEIPTKDAVSSQSEYIAPDSIEAMNESHIQQLNALITA
ncbi:MAG: HD-GYP domain-containing protein [Oleiphilaceae bacterium]|nr:HD-GYP domain-containing protein [Oleiphilaceae bacterium]